MKTLIASTLAIGLFASAAQAIEPPATGIDVPGCTWYRLTIDNRVVETCNEAFANAGQPADTAMGSGDSPESAEGEGEGEGGVGGSDSPS